MQFHSGNCYDDLKERIAAPNIFRSCQERIYPGNSHVARETANLIDEFILANTCVKISLLHRSSKIAKKIIIYKKHQKMDNQFNLEIEDINSVPNSVIYISSDEAEEQGWRSQ